MVPKVKLVLPTALLGALAAGILTPAANAITISGQMYELERNRQLTATDGAVTVSIEMAGAITDLATSLTGTYSVTVPDDARFVLVFARGGGVTNRLELRSVAGRNMQIDLPVPEFKQPCCSAARCRSLRPCRRGRW